MDMTSEMIFAERLRAEREQRRWSQADLGDRLRQTGTALHQTQIARIELGQRALRLNEAIAIARLLDIPLKDLIGPSPDDEELDKVEELKAQIRDQRKRMVDLMNASMEVRKDIEAAQMEKDQALRDLEHATFRLGEAFVAHREIEKQLSVVRRNMDELGGRLKLRIQDDLEKREAKADTLNRDDFSGVAGEGAEISIPYNDSDITIRIERTRARKWICVVVASNGSEIWRSGDFSSGHGAVSARNIMVRKILHEGKRIEEFTRIEELTY